MFINMKTCFVLLILLAFTSPIFAQAESATAETTSSDSVVFTCPMHPEVTSRLPGKCPKCGMTLVQKKSSSSDQEMDPMMCPAHGMMNGGHKQDKATNGNMKMMDGMMLAMAGMMVVMATVMTIVLIER